MHGLDLKWFLIIGLAAGWLAGLVVQEHGFGLLGSLVIGVLGAVLGGYLFHMLGFTYDGIAGSLFASLAGSLILLVLIRLIRKR